MLIERRFGDAGIQIVMEEYMEGEEASVLALVDGEHIVMLPGSQDHKRALDNDEGPNTGGMGAYCPTPLVDDELMRQIEREILVPIVDALRRNDIVFQGVLYAGLMLTAGGPKVLEYNCRFGDPEIQPLLMRLRADLVDVMIATCQGKLNEVDLSWDPRCCCSCVRASGGYPGRYETGKTISGIAEAEAMDDVTVFQAGTAMKDNQIVTAGGRVLSVVGTAPTLAEARAKAYHNNQRIHFTGSYYRKDIAAPSEGARVE